MISIESEGYVHYLDLIILHDIHRSQHHFVFHQYRDFKKFIDNGIKDKFIFVQNFFKSTHISLYYKTSWDFEGSLYNNYNSPVYDKTF